MIQTVSECVLDWSEIESKSFTGTRIKPKLAHACCGRRNRLRLPYGVEGFAQDSLRNLSANGTGLCVRQTCKSATLNQERWISNAKSATLN